MNGITVTMALVDLIPVVLFFAAAVILQRDLYEKNGEGRLCPAGDRLCDGAAGRRVQGTVENSVCAERV